MNLLLVALISVVLATGVFNTKPKNSEENKKTETIVKESLENKPAEELAQAEAQAQAEAEAKAAAEAQAASSKRKQQAAAEAQAASGSGSSSSGSTSSSGSGSKSSSGSTSSSGSGSKRFYLMLALYIFGSILLISLGAYFYFRQRDNLSSRNVTRTPDSSRRDFRKEGVVETQEEKPTEEEFKSEPQEEQPTEEEVKSEPQEEQPTEEEVKSEPQEKQTPEDEKKNEKSIKGAFCCQVPQTPFT